MDITYYTYWGVHGNWSFVNLWYSDVECTNLAFTADYAAAVGYALDASNRRVFFDIVSGTCIAGNTYYSLGGDILTVGTGGNILIRVSNAGGALTDVTGIGTFKWNNATDSLYETTNGAGTYTPVKTGYGFNPANVTLTEDVAYARTFVAGGIPSKPINPTPSDAVSDVTLDQQTITWENGGGATSYNVYYGTESGNLSLLESGVTDTSYTVFGITNGSPFDYVVTRYWRIDAVNAYGTTTGDEWSFTTIAFSIPAGGIRGGTPTIDDAKVNLKTRLVAFARNKVFYEDV